MGGDNRDTKCDTGEWNETCFLNVPVVNVVLLSYIGRAIS